jgi:precorrin-8X/cobalt-precorrin-8 methylmutase
MNSNPADSAAVSGGSGSPAATHHLFDRYVMVDWSAASSPRLGRDSIWIAQRTPDNRATAPVNISTRAAAMAALTDLVMTTGDERVLIGFDFTFGYPTGTADLITSGEPGATWADVWRWMAEHISDDENNRNDRFDVAAQLNADIEHRTGVAPLWGYPGRERTDALSRTRPAIWGGDDVADRRRAAAPGFGAREFRIAEQRVRARGHRPFPAWQLAYPGSVGSQMMLGMHHLERWRHDARLDGRVRVWPFDTDVGITSAVVNSGTVLVAEVWPSMFDIDRERHEVLDAAQVLTVVDLLAAADANGTLANWFDPDLTAQERDHVLTEEGWTLGVT